MGEAYYTYPDEGARAVRAARQRVAVFDFDGTSMRGNSPVLLVRELIFQRRINIGVALRIGVWGLAYKLRLPQNEAWVRGQVFKAFEGRSVPEVDAYLRDFYDRVVAPRFRPQVDDLIARFHEQGVCVLVISASFEPIILRMMESHAFDGQVSTRMRVAADGTYTREVEGVPVEGAAKPSAIRRFCDERFGAGKWEVDFAFGDHHSDVPMLEMAGQQAFAVDPDNALARTARERGWQILEW